jgi:hypothetical protein
MPRSIKRSTCWDSERPSRRANASSRRRVALGSRTVITASFMSSNVCGPHLTVKTTGVPGREPASTARPAQLAQRRDAHRAGGGLHHAVRRCRRPRGDRDRRAAGVLRQSRRAPCPGPEPRGAPPDLSLADATTLLESLEQATIAAINGHAVGGGWGLTLACDFRFAAAEAQLWIPEVDLGVPLDVASTTRFVRLVGPARAKEIIMSCARYSAADAQSMGLVPSAHWPRSRPASTPSPTPASPRSMP